MKKLIIKVNNPSDFEGDTADFAVVALSESAISRIKELAKAALSLGVYKVVEFDYSCDLKEAAYDQDLVDGKEPLKEDSTATDCDCLNVTTTDFFWSGYYKGDARWETASIPLTVLDEPGDIDQREED